MHELVEALVQKSDEAWEELTGANRYTMKAQRAKEMGNREDMTMYLDMAEQEMGHSEKIQNAARRILDHARSEHNESSPVLDVMWAAMAERQEEKACNIRMRMKQIRA